jgi:uridine kinase
MNEGNFMSYIIAICGGSGSGKTFLSHAILTNLPHEVSVLSYDNYYRDQSALPMAKRALVNYDDPATLDSGLFIKHLLAIRQGQTIQVPQYDFATHTRQPLPLAFKPTEVVIVEGILTLAIPDAKKYFDFTVFVDADPDIRLARRILRDTSERGRTVNSVITQYFASVKPMHYRYVEPHKAEADFVFINNDNNGIDEVQMKALMTKLMKR